MSMWFRDYLENMYSYNYLGKYEKLYDRRFKFIIYFDYVK